MLLLLSLLVFFWPAIFGGRVLLPTGLIFEQDPLWQPLAPESFTQPSNPALSDQAYQGFPWKLFARRSISQGQLPLWNPYVSGGAPFLGNAQSALLSPFSLLGYVLPLYSSYVVTALLRLFVAGIFTYLFAREIGLATPGALLAMITFAFSGPMIVWLGYPLSSVIVWLPAMLLTIERALTRDSWLYVVATSLVIAGQYLGGHPETSFQVMVVWTIYALYRVIDLEGWRLSQLSPQLAKVIVAGVMGTLLAAVQLLPFAEALAQSATLSARQTDLATGSNSGLVHLLLDWHQWPTMVTALLPEYFGTPLNDSYWYPYTNYVEQNAYAGVLPLALAFAATLHVIIRNRARPRRGLVLFFAALAAASLGVGLHFPMLNVVNELPLFNISASGRLRLIYVFCVAILAGLGLDEMIKHLRGYRRIAIYTLVILTLLSLLLILLTYIGFVVLRDDLIDHGRAFMEAQQNSPLFPRSLEYYYNLVERRYEKKLASLLPSNFVMYLPLLITLPMLTLYHLTKRGRLVGRKVWGCAVLGLTVFDLFLVGLPFNPTIAKENIFPKPEAIQFLEQDSDIYRVVGTGLILHPNTSMVYGLYDVQSYEAVVPERYAALVSQMEGHYDFHFHSLFASVDSPLLDLLNVKYVLTDRELGGRYELVYAGADDIRAYHNREAMPRAFVVYRAEVVEGAASSLARVTEQGFDFRRRVVLERMPPDWQQTSEPAAPSAARIVAYEPNRVELEVETPVDGLLVLTDTYAWGWKAWVDGEPAEVHVANHAFRAVLVPAGAHHVEFVYSPVSFRIGIMISLSTGGMLIALSILLWWKRSRETAR